MYEIASEEADLVVSRPVGFESLRNFWNEWIVRVGVAEEGANCAKDEY